MNTVTKTYLRCGAMLLLLYLISAAIFYRGLMLEHQWYDWLDQVRNCLTLLFAPVLIRYALQLLVLPAYPLLEFLRRRPQSEKLPSVSVLIPAWNEEIGILRTIKSVIQTDYPYLEIIVINDGSTDRTHQLVTEFMSDYRAACAESECAPQLRYLKLPNGGKARALNRGLARAAGEIIITLDADSVMDKQMINRMVSRFNQHRVAAVAGNIIVGNRQKPIGWLQQLEYLHGFCLKRADSNFNAVHIIGGAAAAYRKSALIEAGGFDESIITEDVEMSVRLLALGYQTRYAADAVVFTEGPSDWKGLMNQRLRWKYGRLLTYFKHRALFFSVNGNHSPYLSWFVLPIAVWIEVLLLLEPIILSFFYAYVWLTGHVFLMAMITAAVGTLILLQILFDSQRAFHKNLIPLAPVAWLILQIIDLVELQALWRSVYRLWNRKSLQWQSWARTGIASRQIMQGLENRVNETRKTA